MTFFDTGTRSGPRTRRNGKWGSTRTQLVARAPRRAARDVQRSAATAQIPLNVSPVGVFPRFCRPRYIRSCSRSCFKNGLFCEPNYRFHHIPAKKTAEVCTFPGFHAYFGRDSALSTKKVYRSVRNSRGSCILRTLYDTRY